MIMLYRFPSRPVVRNMAQLSDVRRTNVPNMAHCSGLRNPTYRTWHIGRPYGAEQNRPDGGGTPSRDFRRLDDSVRVGFGWGEFIGVVEIGPSSLVRAPCIRVTQFGRHRHATRVRCSPSRRLVPSRTPACLRWGGVR